MAPPSDIVRTRRVYQALGLPDFAASDDVKRAYREMALIHHPDKNRTDPDAVERFKVINAAYQVLSDTQRKSDYDASLAAARQQEARISRTEASMAGDNRRTTTGFARSATQYADELHSYREARRSTSHGPGARPAAAPPRTASAASPASGSRANPYAAGSSSSPPPPKTAHSDDENNSAASSTTAAQEEMKRKREKQRERESARRLEREKEEKREKEIEKMKRLQAQKQTEEDRRKREQEKLRDKISRVFNPSPVFPNAASTSSTLPPQSPTDERGGPTMNATMAANLAADIRQKAAASAAAARPGRSSSARPMPPKRSSSASGAPAATTPSDHPYDSPSDASMDVPSTPRGAAAANAAGGGRSSKPPPTRAEMMREDRARHAEMRQRNHEQQIEGRLAQLRATEEKRLQDELSERRAVYARRLVEVEAEEDQERHHYISMQEAHERSCVAAQLKRVEIAYAHLCQRQGLFALERDRRRRFDFLLVVLESELLLQRREGGGRARLLEDERVGFDRLAANHHSIYPILATQCVQRKAIDYESDADMKIFVKQEASARQRLAVEFAAASRIANTADMERSQRAKLSAAYWDHKTAVMLERDEVKQRDNVVTNQIGLWAELRLTEAESRQRTVLLSEEVADFTTIAFAKAHSLGAQLTALADNVGRLTDRLGDAQRTETAMRAEIAELKETLDDEADAHHAEVLRLREDLSRATAQASEREKDLELRMESLERLLRKEREDATAKEKELLREIDQAEAQLGTVEARLRESERDAAALRRERHSADQTAAEMEQKIADLETSVALGRTPTNTSSGAATPTSPPTAVVVGGTGTPRRRGSTTTTDASSNAATSAYKHTVESQAATIATLKRRIVALEALVDSRVGTGDTSSSPAPTGSSGGSQQQQQSNRELVTLLCAENKRLLDANAALLDENRALVQRHHQERADALAASPQQQAAPSSAAPRPANGPAKAAEFGRTPSSVSAVTPKGTTYQSAQLGVAYSSGGGDAAATSPPPPPAVAQPRNGSTSAAAPSGASSRTPANSSGTAAPISTAAAAAGGSSRTVGAASTSRTWGNRGHRSFGY